QQQLQLAILRLEFLQPLRFRDLHATVLGSPAVERLLRDPILAADLLVAVDGLCLLEDSDDLFFSESFSLHVSFLLLPENSLWRWVLFTGRRSPITLFSWGHSAQFNRTRRK